ncbi:hypothetical protein FOPG_10836 [Fusarium oxysporum f. sp. conglutinans race 2 54008]|uniref:Uncharacterized protein n=1 Tax=Fusarium oxysporum f. sp. conglutinans race 2 54008 TaxID=1089457 RepID=X0HQS6_FUSOX|nr:hypothetical protein FOPG_10836 [Fusarium oxysporum f. sp. conglutinans race 2 54008]
MKPVAYNKKPMVNGMERHLKRVEKETKKIYDIFFADGKGPGIRSKIRFPRISGSPGTRSIPSS